MPRPDEPLERLRDALDRLAAQDAGGLVAEARAQAHERVRKILSDALVDSLIARVEQEIAPRPPQRAVPAPSPAPQPERAAPSTDERVYYVYGVVGANTIARLPEPEGVTPLTEGPVAAVARLVPAAEFDETQLRERLSDMDWVERVARDHEQVLDEIRRRLTVIPMRMCTVYRTEQRVREMLRAEAAPFQEALAYLEGKTEWGVKVFADRGQAKAALAERDAPGSAAEVGTGAAYMERRRQELDEAERISQLLDAAASEIHDRLGSAAADSLAAPPQRPEVAGRAGEMVLNGVYLVDDDQQDSFHDTVHALEAEFGALGLELVETGPWPAYNFVPGTIGAAW